MATMTDIDNFLPYVLPKAPTTPIPEAYAAIREAAKVICRRLKLWRTVIAITVTSPEFQTVVPPTHAAITSIETARLDGADLMLVTPDWLDENYPSWRTDDSATTRYITQIEPNSLTLYPKQTGSLAITALLQPAETAMMLPDFLLSLHAELIGSGAGGMILATVPDPETYNPGLANSHLIKFNSEVDRLNAGQARSQIRVPRRSRSSFF